MARRDTVLLISIAIVAVFGAVRVLDDSLFVPKDSSNAPLASGGAIVEANSFETSTHPIYWLNSGAYAYDENGTIRTVVGELRDESWRAAYAETNPVDTDGGLHPQNIFRLLTKSTHLDFAGEATITIRKIIQSESPNRNESNGALLMLRYVDDANLYYAGLRVDGAAIIKKKLDSEYYTLATAPVFAFADYDRETMPNLLPIGVPIGMRAEVQSLDESRVLINFYIDIGKSGAWLPVLSHVDQLGPENQRLITSPGHGGIRSDFMEITIDDFKVEDL